ncbi:MAG: cupredoxin domain-containing protein [Actinomycetota bacterium]
MKKTLVVPVALLVAFGACSGGGGSDASGDIDMIEGQRFEPETLTVQAGDTITFVNSSNETHTVTAYEDEIPDGAAYFASGDFSNEEEARADLSGGLIDPEATYEITLDEPGTYQYFCIPHEGAEMTGEIVVE